jgi:hypothetical protein
MHMRHDYIDSFFEPLPPDQELELPDLHLLESASQSQQQAG